MVDGTYHTAEMISISRRLWLKRMGVTLAAAGTGLGIYVHAIEPHWIDIVHRPLSIPRLPQELIGKSLVHISDLHIGSVVDPDYMSRALRQVSELSPDILVITGDLVNGTDKAKLSDSVRLLASNMSFDRMATIACLGNHDYGRTWNEHRKADELTERLRDIGLTVLRNDSFDVHGLIIAGLEDRWGTNWEEAASTELIKESRPDVVLCHNPDVCDEAIWGGFQGWILSGHTHGGQCKPPFLPPPITPVKNKRYTSGEFELSGGRKLYINRALGYLQRIRFLVRPEITIFELCLSEPKDSNVSIG